MKNTLTTLGIVALVGFLLINLPLTAQPGASRQNWEYATVKWDGSDRLYQHFPESFQLVRLSDFGVAIPNEAREEEFCLNWAANKLAEEGWEAVTLDSRRMLFRRAR